jgi:glycosyltransferase involved in cell wall biosynthesis
MRRFAGDFEVLFIESLPMRSLAAVDRGELGRAWQKLRAGSRLRTPEPHLHVLRAPPIPPAGRLGEAALLTMLRAQIVFARRRMRLNGPAITWFSVPTAAPLRSHLGERGSLFYYQDRYDQFTDVNAPRLRELIGQLARGCEVSIATSNDLAHDLRALGAAPELVPHGVDAERFAGDPDPPDDLSGLERPLVGYVGILDDYLDLDAVRAVAEHLEHGTVVLVGAANADVSVLDHPRIVRLGFRPYAKVPAYLAAFACCICPFQITPLTTAVNPIKLREYLAAGRPVVSTPLPAVLEYRDVVEVASGRDEFADAVIRALGPDQDSADSRERRRARVRGESWDAVAARIRPSLLSLAGVAEPAPRPSDVRETLQGS